MIERILVATDGSESSQRALDRAHELASSLNCTISVLHVVPNADWTFPEACNRVYLNRYFQEQQRLRKHSQQVLNAALARLGGVPAQGVLRESLGRLVAEVIVQEADEQHSDLIVLGGRCHPGLRGLYSVSTAQAVLRHAQQPVLLVHTPPQPSRLTAGLAAWFGTISGASAR